MSNMHERYVCLKMRSWLIFDCMWSRYWTAPPPVTSLPVHPLAKITSIPSSCCKLTAGSISRLLALNGGGFCITQGTMCSISYCRQAPYRSLHRLSLLRSQSAHDHENHQWRSGSTNALFTRTSSLGPELVMGWVHPWVGLGWVGLGQFFLNFWWVGLGWVETWLRDIFNVMKYSTVC